MAVRQSKWAVAAEGRGSNGVAEYSKAPANSGLNTPDTDMGRQAVERVLDGHEDSDEDPVVQKEEVG